MKNRTKKIILISMIIISILIIIFSIINKGSYSLENDDKTYNQTFTRTQMQKMVVSTALSYYYNQRYTDYEEYDMTNASSMPNAVKFGWPNFKVSPEGLSRSNLTTLNCAVFVSNVYLHALGFDFSKGYNSYIYSDPKYHQNRYFNYGIEPSTASITNFAGIYFGKEENTNCANDIATEFPGTGIERKVNYCMSEEDPNNSEKYIFNGQAYYRGSNVNGNGKSFIYINYKDNNHSIISEEIDGETVSTYSKRIETSNIDSEFVYYYHVEGTVGEAPTPNKEGYYEYSESTEKQATIKSDITRILQPGDLIVYRKINSDNKITGHIMLYISYFLNLNEKGFIHASGKDYDTTDEYYGEDFYSVKYDTWDTFVTKQLFAKSKINKLYSVAIIRPLNTYCVNDNCTVSNNNVRNTGYYSKTKLENTIARDKLNNLKIEQFEYKGDDIEAVANKYNSVNPGGQITYALKLTNKKSQYYCKNGGSCITKECCGTDYWAQASNRPPDGYTSLTITAEIPDNTTYQSCNPTNCTFKDGKVTWENIEIPYINDIDNGDNDNTTNLFTYSVAVDNGTKDAIVNPGMTIDIDNGAATLKLDELSIQVNKTINKGSDISSLQSRINNYNSANGTGLDYIKYIYSQMNLGIDTNALTYDNIKNAIFNLENVYNTETGKLEYSYYTKKTTTEINALNNDTYKNINKMLVTGLFGGRLLGGNGENERAKLVFKSSIQSYMKQRTLEVGDIIICIDTANSSNNKAYIFYGYGSSSTEVNLNNAIFASFDGNSITKYGPSGITIENSGWRIFRSMYGYDLFVILRPSKQIDMHNLVNLVQALKFKNTYSLITNINTTMTINNIGNYITPLNGSSYTIKDKNGNAVTGRNYIKTGDVVAAIDADNSYAQNYKLIVRGDIDADGDMDNDDAQIMITHVVNQNGVIEEDNYYAGDLIDDNRIRINDVAKILSEISI